MQIYIYETLSLVDINSRQKEGTFSGYAADD